MTPRRLRGTDAQSALGVRAGAAGGGRRPGAGRCVGSTARTTGRRTRRAGVATVTAVGEPAIGVDQSVAASTAGTAAGDAGTAVTAIPAVCCLTGEDGLATHCASNGVATGAAGTADTRNGVPTETTAPATGTAGRGAVAAVAALAAGTASAVTAVTADTAKRRGSRRRQGNRPEE